MPNKCLDSILERREQYNKIIIGELKKIILNTLESGTLEKLQKEKYSFRSRIYHIGSEKLCLGFSKYPLYDHLKDNDRRFNSYDIETALRELEGSDKVKSTVLDLSSAHNPDSNYKTIYYLPNNQ